MTEAMSKAEAVAFFSAFYGGEHHIPGYSAGVKPFGPFGWRVSHSGDLSTYDCNELTRLVFMAHDRCIRVSVKQSGPRRVGIVIFKRVRVADNSYARHPSLADAVEKWRKAYPLEHPDAVLPAPNPPKEPATFAKGDEVRCTGNRLANPLSTKGATGVVVAPKGCGVGDVCVDFGDRLGGTWLVHPLDLVPAKEPSE